MSEIANWSTTAASNTTVNSVFIGEGMAPSNVNNGMREIMAADRAQWEGAEWFDWGDTPTYASTTSFTIAGDVTSRYTTNRRLKLADATTLYGKVASSSYSSPNTTINVTLDSGSLSVSLTGVSLSILDPTNPSVVVGASDVAFTPAGNVASTDVQAAIEELDSEKSATTHNHDSTYLQITNAAFVAGLNGQHSGLVVQTNAANPTYQVDVDADAIVLKDSTGAAYLAESVNLTASITASGANGLDTGSEASSTWYYIWVIYNGSTVASLLSTSSTAPTMPSGYTYKGLFGAVYNNGSSNFVAFKQQGKSVLYTTNQTILDSTGLTTSAWTALSVAAFYPPTAKKIHVGYASAGQGIGLSHLSSGNAGWYDKRDQTGSTTTFGGVFPTAYKSSGAGSIRYAASIYYYVESASGTFVALGWEY